MSRTFSIVCPDTKTKLWIGQRNSSAPLWHMYATERDIEKLERFLTAHAGMSLVFNDDEKLEEEYEEFQDDGSY